MKTTEHSQKNDREAWILHRKQWEGSPKRSSKGGPKVKKWRLFYAIVRFFFKFLKSTFIGTFLKKNSLKLKLSDIKFGFASLPIAFDGYRILHITDLHLDQQPELADIIATKISSLQVDLVIMTGDYQDAFNLDPYENEKLLEKIFEAIKPLDGFICTLGNHDSHKVTGLLSKLGARVLVNESCTITRKNESLIITGLDDVHYFYSEAAIYAMMRQKEASGFKILAVHSPELYMEAVKFGYDFYITGHTHGGQVCLPFQVPIITHAKAERQMINGKWQKKTLKGYTTRGAGTSGFPMRLNCPAELLLATLQKT